ncbi:hypothetical protein IKF89_01300 [Candidatus Saccharibacteria bacterium]|nr:hypothetical protein [Candidatus Saccharibacteria bacterium]
MHKFGTDGIRSKAEDFTPDFLARIIKGLVDYAGDNIKIFLAGDTRESTEWILQDLAAACETFGIEYASAGIFPTPGINYCFYEMNFDFAIDVTASHNPFTDNGIKIFERGKTQGTKLDEVGRAKIEAALASSDFFYTPISPTIREDLHTEATDLYLEHLTDYLSDADFSDLHIGMDCANGATSVINKTVFENLGASVELINCQPDYNTEINQDCGSTHLDQLKQLVTKNHLDFGVAFDGDGDRCLAIDAEGNEVDGDQMLAFLSQFLQLDSIVTTVMANQGLLNWAKDNNIHAEITAVGDPNVVAAMLEKDIKIGSEQNGHVILPGLTSGDGMLTALMIAKAVTKSSKSLNNLAGIITKFPQVIVNMPATPEQKDSLKTSPAAKQLLLDYDQKLKSVAGRLLVRPSGTENLIRITMWGNDAPTIDQLANELKTKLGETL